jgi:hypothetical protein
MRARRADKGIGGDLGPTGEKSHSLSPGSTTLNVVMRLAVLEIEICHVAVVHELQNVSNREVSPTISVKNHISPP